jgi:hypothetical protein
MNEYNQEIEIIKEKILLKKVQILTPELINIIYSYLNGKSKYICFKKYEFIEKNVKNDFYKGYTFWNYIKNVINIMSKNQFILFIKNNIQHYPSIINRIWYLSLDTNSFYDGKKLFDLWCDENIINEKFNLEKLYTIDFKIKQRMIDAIYNYILRAIDRFEREKKIMIENNFTNYNNIKGFEFIEKSFKLYKSLEYIKETLIIN